MPNHPPRWATKILRLFCSDKYLDELEGDLTELYYRNQEETGMNRARWKYILGVLLSFRFYRARRPFHITIQPMIRFNLLVAFRHGMKYLSFSLVNILGLSLGIAASLYISLFILNELNVDQFHHNKNELYKVVKINKDSGNKMSLNPSPLGEAIQNSFPTLKICRIGNDPIKIGEEKPLLIEDFYWSDSTFFDLFSFPLLEGDPATALKEPNSLVLTESIAKKLFHDSDPLDQTIDIKIYDSDKVLTMRITGIAQDPPHNSTVKFSALGTIQNAENLYTSLVKSWGFNWVNTYIYLPPDRSDFISANFHSTMDQFFQDKDLTNLDIQLQPFTEVYLHSRDVADSDYQGSIQTVYIMAAIGLLILVISLLNYINLNTARVFTRMEELKIKKSLGSGRRSILWQYLIEALMYIFISAIIGTTLVVVLTGPVNHIFDLHLTLSVVTLQQCVLMVLFLITIGILAGVISAIKLIQGFDSQNGLQITRYREKNISGRKILMGVQYMITLFMTTTAILVYLQFKYMRNFDLGFNPNQLVYIPVDDRDMQQKITTIKTEMARVPGVAGAAVSGEKLPSDMNNAYSISWEGLKDDAFMSINVISVDPDYFKVAGMEIVGGQPFTHDYAVDSGRSVILNQQAKQLISDPDIVGKSIRLEDMDRTVIGVVRDFHYKPLKNDLDPAVYIVSPPGYRVSPDNIFLRIDTRDLSELQSSLAGVWKKFTPDPMDLNFVSQGFAQAYNSEKQLTLLAGSLTGIAIVIAFLGLFGLITFMIRQKTKELCIRKILGAPLTNITKVLSRDFIIIFCVAMITSAPLAYFFGKEWLANYPYNIGFNPLILLSATVICLLISALVIGIKIAGLSSMNPANVLRNE